MLLYCQETYINKLLFDEPYIHHVGHSLRCLQTSYGLFVYLFKLYHKNCEKSIKDSPKIKKGLILKRLFLFYEKMLKLQNCCIISFHFSLLVAGNFDPFCNHYVTYSPVAICHNLIDGFHALV